MKVPCDWNEESEAQEAVVDALLDAGLYTIASTERGEYGENGTIRFVINGRSFDLQLSEIV